MSFFAEENHFKASLENVEGLNVSFNSMYFDNFFSYHPVKCNGVEIGYFDVVDVDQNVKSSIEIIIPKKFKIPQDSKVEIKKNDPHGLLNKNYINIVLGNSTVFLKDKDSFI